MKSMQWGPRAWYAALRDPGLRLLLAAVLVAVNGGAKVGHRAAQN